MGKKRGIAVAVFSDLHVNSTVGLNPPDVELPEGQTVSQSVRGRWLWDNWLAYVDMVRRFSEGRRLFAVCNGDLCDFNHKQRAPQYITTDKATALRMAVDALYPMLDLNPEKVFIVSGTEAHTGLNRWMERKVAADIGAEYSETKRVAFDGVAFDFQHEGEKSGRSWTAQNAISRMAYEIVHNHVIRGEKPPMLAYRAHVHIPADSYDAFPTRAIITPSFQLQTAYFKTLNRTGAILPIGGHVVVCEDGKYEVHKYEVEPEREGYDAY